LETLFEVVRGVGKLSHSSLSILLRSWWFSPFWGWRERWVTNWRWKREWEAQLEDGGVAENLGVWFPSLSYFFYL